MSIITHQRHPAHKRFLAGLLGIPLLLAAGCQTPQTGTVAPPATGMIGQPAAYGSWATPPQGAAYPPTVSAPPMQVAGAAPPPMPGPATQWQAAAPAVPAAPAAPAGNNWSWSQPSTGAPPSMQQYGNQLQAQANQYQQSMTNQAQQYANQMQAQPQQWTNQAQQSLANQQQQLGNQWQSTANQYQQGLNNQMQQFNGQVQQNLQAGQQQLNQQMQQAMPQYPAGPQQQTANGSWWPFSNTSGMPPARATPAVTPRY